MISKRVKFLKGYKFFNPGESAGVREDIANWLVKSGAAVFDGPDAEKPEISEPVKPENDTKNLTVEIPTKPKKRQRWSRVKR